MNPQASALGPIRNDSKPHQPSILHSSPTPKPSTLPLQPQPKPPIPQTNLAPSPPKPPSTRATTTTSSMSQTMLTTKGTRCRCNRFNRDVSGEPNDGLDKTSGPSRAVSSRHGASLPLAYHKPRKTLGRSSLSSSRPSRRIERSPSYEPLQTKAYGCSSSTQPDKPCTNAACLPSEPSRISCIYPCRYVPRKHPYSQDNSLELCGLQRFTFQPIHPIQSKMCHMEHSIRAINPVLEPHFRSQTLEYGRKAGNAGRCVGRGRRE